MMTLTYRFLFLFFMIFGAVNFFVGEILPAEKVSPSDAERSGENIRQSWIVEVPIDESALIRSGVRRLESKHLILYTDFPSSKEVDELPKLFDLLVDQLCDYFELNRKNYESFKLEGFLIDDFEKFRLGGAVRQVPNLRNGYTLRCRIWVRNSDSEYYRRHLLFHEGTHAFMGYAFGSWGPAWYCEGTAELFGTHRLKDNGDLKFSYFPKSRNELERWGRIDFVRNDFAGKQDRTFKGIFALKPENYDENEAYGWSWAFSVFCENHPRYRTAFRQTAWNLHGQLESVDQRFLRLLCENVRETSPDLNDRKILSQFDNEWIDFAANLDYHYDFERTRIEYGKMLKAVSNKGAEIQIRADRGWQSAGIRLERGKTYRLSASGRFQLADKPKIWQSEPNGITIRYYHGSPVGILLATLIPDLGEHFDIKNETPAETSGIGFTAPRKVGLSDVWTTEVSGELFFRINDFPSELSDNNGNILVKITQQ
jgi:hypothetical protein